MRNGLVILGMFIATGCYLALLYLIAGFTPITMIVLAFMLLFVILCTIASQIYYRRPDVEQYFYSIPGNYVAIAGLIVQAIVGLILATTVPIIRIVLIVEVILLGVFGAIECYTLYGGMRARQMQENTDYKTGAMRRLRDQADVIWKTEGDYEWQRKAKEVAELVAYANPVRGVGAEEFEQAVSSELNALQHAVRTKDQTEFDAARDRIRILVSR